jgi:hypothetical protein
LIALGFNNIEALKRIERLESDTRVPANAAKPQSKKRKV